MAAAADLQKRRKINFLPPPFIFKKMTPISQFKRYMWLVDLLHVHGALTKEEIDAYWSRSSLNEKGESRIPRRTFMRMKNDIGSLFGIYIECLRTRSNKYTLENDEDMKQGHVQQWLINGFSINNVLMDSQQLKDRIILENIPSGNKYLTQAIEAMRENRTLLLTYQSFTMKLPRDIEVLPYCLRCFKQRWYILGKKRGDKEPHFFSLDRVQDLEITPNKFRLPEDFDADSFFYNYYGIMQGDTPVETVQLRVTPFYANYLRSLPLHHSQKEIERTDEYSVFEYHLAPTSDFIQELRSVLPEITVLHPLWLRSKFIEEAKEILENYKSCK